MKKIILSIMLITVMALSLLISPKVNAAESDTNEFDALVDKVEDLIADGTLPSWHSKYKENPYYQEYLTHFLGNDIIESFGEYEEDLLVELLEKLIENDAKMIKEKIMIDSVDILNGISANESLGFYFDGINLYFLWTSKYYPTSYLSLSSITFNIYGTSKTFNVATMTDTESVCSHLEGDSMIEASRAIYYPKDNLQINITPLAFYHLCSDNKKIYTGGLTYNNKFFDLMDFTSFTVESFTMETAEGTYYDLNETIEDEATFDMVNPCLFEGSERLVTKLLKYTDLKEVAVQSLDDRYRVVFNYDYPNEYLNGVYLYAKVKYNGELKECAIMRNSKQIGHHETYDFIELSKEQFELLEIKIVRLSVWNCDYVSSLDTYDTIYSTTDPRTLKLNQLHDDATDPIWTSTDGEMITDIPEEVEGFDEELPIDIIDNETNPDEDNNSNNNNDIDIDNNNDNTDKDDDKAENKDEENTKLEQTMKIILTVTLTIVLIFILYKVFCFIKKFIN